MSTAKRSRRRQTDARAASPLPASKRLKTAKDSHVPSRPGLDFLVNEDERDGRRLEAKLTNGKSTTKASKVGESRTIVAPDVRDQVGASQQNAIDISSAAESSSEEESESENEDVGRKVNGVAHAQPLTNGHVSEDDEDVSAKEEQQAVAGAQDEDQHMAEAEDEQPAESEEPSFGDLLQARHPDAIDVQASYPNFDQYALVPSTGENTLSAPSGATLRTVLTQALKTNDKDLLERCFQTTDLNDIRATIERLQSQHVATLLQGLAERIYKRPGRTGTLVTWIQWSMVAHGAYLATQPDVMKRLRSLAQVLRERAHGLQPLLRLKGKLDMLGAQLELRQRMMASSRAANGGEDDDEEVVVYVEGQDDEDSEDADDIEATGNGLQARIPQRASSKSVGQTATPRSDISSDGSESEDDMPNGVTQEAEDESSEAGDQGNGLIDMEAEETSDDDSAEEEDSDESADSDAGIDEDSGHSEDESDAGVQPMKPAKLNRKR